MLIRRKNPPRAGEWSLPGGRQEWGEPVARTARREVFEETGVAIETPRLLDVIDLIEHDAEGDVVTHFTLVDFVAAASDLDPIAGDDAIEARWFDPAELESLSLWDETQRVIALALKAC